MTNQMTNQMTPTTSSLPTALAWHNLTYSVDDWTHGRPNGQRQVLRSLCGQLPEGSLTALLGPSGAGKTSLMRALMGNCDGVGTSGGGGHISDETRIYVQKAQQQQNDSDNIIPRVCFIDQAAHRTLVPSLTVRQALEYAFRLKNNCEYSTTIFDCNNNQISNKNKKQTLMSTHIRQVMEWLALDPSLLDRKVSKCSGGEQRRLAIGQELTSVDGMPSLMMLDEPTTGLDSRSALQVAQLLRRLAHEHGITVLASIHAPSPKALCHFDQLYILARGGRCLYSGSPERLGLFLESSSRFHRISSTNERPIEAIMRLACQGDGASEFGAENSEIIPQQNVESSKYCKHQLDLLTLKSHQMQLLPEGLPNVRKRFLLTNLLTTTCRQARITFLAERTELLVKLAGCLGVILFLSSFFRPEMVEPSGCLPLRNLHLNLNSTSDSDQHQEKQCTDNYWLLMENLNYLVLIMLFLGYICTFVHTLMAHQSIRYFRSEHRNHWYSVSCHYLSTQAVAMLQVMLFTLVLSPVVYFMAHEHKIDLDSNGNGFNWVRFAAYCACMFLFLLYTESMGNALSQLSDNMFVCVVLSVGCYSVLFMLNGFFMDTEGTKAVSIASDLIASKFIVRLLFYVFYGLDRCDPRTEYSFVLYKYHVDEDRVTMWMDLLSVGLNICLFQLTAFGLMFSRANGFTLLNTSALMAKVSSFFRKMKDKKKRSKTLENDSSYDNINGHQLQVIQMNNNNDYNYNSSNGTENACFASDITDQSSPNSLSNSSKMILIAWRNVSLRSPDQKVKILNQISGHFFTGSLNAIMGVSGAGKSTLLKLLNGQFSGDSYHLSEESMFYLNSNQMSTNKSFSSCFITQDVSGHLYPGLTVLQNLVYASRFKNSGYKEDKLDHERIALNLLKEFDLEQISQTTVNRCSGGEQKRLALALELTSVVMPSLVCFDEPTSGLDSASALKVITCLHQLTRRHVDLALVTIIHQPSSEIVSLYDQLYVLARGGVCLYSGPPSDISERLAQIGERNDLSEPPLETLIELSCSTMDEDLNVKKLVHLEKEHFERNIAIDLINNNQNCKQVKSMITGQNQTHFSLCSLRIHLSRQLAYLRTHAWKELLVLGGMTLLYVLTLRLTFDQEALERESGCVDLGAVGDLTDSCNIVELIGRLVDSVKYLMFLYPLFNFLPSLYVNYQLFQELPLVRNEHRNGWYSPASYYLSRTLVDLVSMSVLMALYLYLVEGNIFDLARLIQSPYTSLLGAELMYFPSIQVLCLLTVVTSGGSPVRMVIGMTCVAMVMIQLTNLFVSLSNISLAYQALASLSPLRYLLDAVMMLRFGFGRCDREGGGSGGGQMVSMVLKYCGLTGDGEDFRRTLVRSALTMGGYQVAGMVMLHCYLEPNCLLRSLTRRFFRRVKSCVCCCCFKTNSSTTSSATEL